MQFHGTIIIRSDRRSEFINTPFRLLIWRYQFFVQDWTIADLNVSLCMWKQICKGSLVTIR